MRDETAIDEIRKAKPFIALEAMAHKRGSGNARAGEGVGDTGELSDEPLAELPKGTFSISGRVLSEGGQALAGIEVIGRVNRLFNTNQALNPAQIAGARRTYSGPDGAFAFPQLAAGEYQLSTVATERYPSATLVVRTGSDNARLVLREAQQTLLVYGQIKSSNGESLPGVRIVPSTQPSSASYSDASGAYQVLLMLGGKDQSVTLRLRLANFKEQVLRLNRADFEGVEARQLDATMEPIGALATVTGRVRTNAGQTVARETLVLYSPSVGRHYHATTGESGNFEINDVPASNDYRVSIQPRGPYQDYFRDKLQISSKGLTLDVVLEPLAMGALSGQMIDVQGNPLPNFTLWLRSNTVSQMQPVEVTSNAGGHFRVVDIPQGEVILQTLSSPYISVKGVQLSPGEEQYVNLVLDWGRFQLTGRVVDHAGKPLAVPEIKLSWSYFETGASSLSIRKTAATSDGRFQFADLGPGLHTLSIETPGFKKFQLSYEVGGVGANPVEVRLEEEVTQ